MGKVYRCDGCEVEQAVLMVQNLDTGEALFFGPRCALTWAEGTVEAFREALGADAPDGDGQAATGELSAGGDTPGATVAAPGGTDPAALSPSDNLDNDTAGGGGNDERVRTPDPGTTGLHPVGAGTPRADDAGADQRGGRGSGSGVGGSTGSNDGADAAGQRAGSDVGDGPAGSAGLGSADAGDGEHLAGTGTSVGRDLTSGD